MRRAVASVLTLVLALAGVWRGLDAAPSVAFAGILGTICHHPLAGDFSSGDPGVPASHSCCDDCALCAAVTLPAGPVLSPPKPALLAKLVGVFSSDPTERRRPRTPKQSQGPPLA